MQTDEILDARYPNLNFLLRFGEERALPFPLHSEDIEKEVERALAPLPLKKLQLLYIFGIGLGHYYPPLKQWLAEDRERDLIFIEEDLSALRAFLKSDHASAILAHPQIHIRFNMDRRRLSAFLEECAQDFPIENIEIIALASYKKHYRSRTYRMRLKLHRLTTVNHAIFIENLHYNLFFKNLLPNFKRFNGAFFGNHLKDQFQGVPAIICGAGPSLSKDIETLRTLDNRALIFAGGSAITALSNQGILPHFGMAIDPNFEEYHRFAASSAFEIPLFYVNRLLPRIFDTCNGPRGYLHTMTGGMAELWMEEKLGIEGEPLQEGFDLEALSVTTTCIQLACSLGCNPIILSGVDLAFTAERSYVSGVVPEARLLLDERREEVRVSEKLLSRQDIYGQPIHTLVKWVMESSAISHFAKKNPERTFINATAGGLGFKNIPNQPLQSIPLQRSSDLHGKIHQLIERHRLPTSTSQIDLHLSQLKASLKEAKSYVQAALSELRQLKGQERDPESGRLIFIQMELESLDSYTCFLRDPDLTFHQVLTRKYRPTTWSAPDHAMKWNFLHSKWLSFDNLVDFYLDMFDK
ncbi:MAG: hypothetical protein K1060chlam2_00569 [Chlamydiae bacterium]|nr:hypothetical protein [Chlamydiota bacterium]